MHELTTKQLAALGGRDYINEIKNRLRDDSRWAFMIEPELVEYTRWALETIIASIDAQQARVSDGDDPKWVKSMVTLRRLCQARLSALSPSQTPISSTREARAWRAFSARLAMALDDHDPTALDSLQAPYGGLTARQWLDARHAKREDANV